MCRGPIEPVETGADLGDRVGIEVGVVGEQFARVGFVEEAKPDTMQVAPVFRRGKTGDQLCGRRVPCCDRVGVGDVGLVDDVDGEHFDSPTTRSVRAANDDGRSGPAPKRDGDRTGADAVPVRLGEAHGPTFYTAKVPEVIVYAHDRFVDHRPPAGHPERPERFGAAVDGLTAAGLADALEWREPTSAPVEAILGVHDRGHVDHLERVGGQEGVRLDPDTHMSSHSLEAARLAAGAGLDAIDALRAGDGSAAFCLVRPPGHHARPNEAMGFCLYNNIAVAADALTRAGERVAIVDYDAHHGNGTQDIFFDRDDVLFVSLHEYPQYPGTGAGTEVGRDAGLGSTINFPMPSGSTGDAYLEAFDTVVIPSIERFGADWILISAGFDAHRDDPLTNLGLTSGDHAALTRRLADSSSRGRTIAFLEGGYDLDALALSTVGCVGALIGPDTSLDVELEAQSSGGPGREIVAAVRDLHNQLAD